MLTKEHILSLQKKIKKQIEYINNGGCPHFAYYFSKKLIELKIPHKIVFLNDSEISLSKDKFSPCAHVCIYIPTIGYIDGYYIEGPRCKKGFITKFSTNTTKLGYFRSVHGWNPRYNKNQNSQLEKLINEHNYGVSIRKSNRSSTR